MPVEIVYIHDEGGNFVGYTSLRRVPNGAKLTSTNVWPSEQLSDLQEQVGRLNSDSSIKQHWPRTDDPEVQKLLNDPNFMPYETTTERVVDDANSYLVYKDDEVTENDAPVLDLEASVLAYKDVVVPARPTEVQLRFKRAHEIVARRRAGLGKGEEVQWTNG